MFSSKNGLLRSISLLKIFDLLFGQLLVLSLKSIKGDIILKPLRVLHPILVSFMGGSPIRLEPFTFPFSESFKIFIELFPTSLEEGLRLCHRSSIAAVILLPSSQPEISLPSVKSQTAILRGHKVFAPFGLGGTVLGLVVGVVFFQSLLIPVKVVVELLGFLSSKTIQSISDLLELSLQLETAHCS